MPKSETEWSYLDSIKAVVTDSPLTMTLMDLEGTLLALSKAGELSLGLTTEEAIGHRVHDLFHDGAQTFADLKAAGAWERGVSLPIRSDHRPDGTQFWYQISSWPWRDSSGSVRGLIHQIRDVSMEERTLQQLNLTEAVLDAAVESMPSMLGVIDLQTKSLIRVNRAYEAFVGQPREVVIGKDAPANFTEDDLRELDALMSAAVASGELLVSERELLDGQGRRRTILRRLQAIEDRIGRKYLLFVMDDITANREAAKALQEAVAGAEAANAAKSEFLALISHEIRTPLNGVLGMAQVMARQPLSAPQQDRLGMIIASGQALLTILNGVLDLSKIEAGQLEIERIEFELADGLRDAAASLSALASAKGLVLNVDVDDVQGVYRGDPTRIRQIVSNLISNAVKFTETGEVRLSARREGELVVIAVSDTGPGIAQSAMQRLFQKFVQADSSTTRLYGGTGLGLAICRQLAELMGGTIDVQSEVGKGACFTVTLPLDRSERSAPVRVSLVQDETPLRGLRVLAAEDNPTNQRVLAAILGEVGVRLTLVGDGVQAVDAYKAQPWDVVLMDVQMPVMDGPTAVGEIRRIEREEGRQRTPVIALTANAMEHQKAEYLSCGMDRVVSKPLSVADLFSAIHELVAVATDTDAPARDMARSNVGSAGG